MQNCKPFFFLFFLLGCSAPAQEEENESEHSKPDSVVAPVPSEKPNYSKGNGTIDGEWPDGNGTSDVEYPDDIETSKKEHSNKNGSVDGEWPGTNGTTDVEYPDGSNTSTNAKGTDMIEYPD